MPDAAVLVKQLDDGTFAATTTTLDDGTVAVLDAFDAECCCLPGLCPELPDNIKVTLSGRFTMFRRRTNYPSGFEPATHTVEHEVVVPELEVSATKSQNQLYQATVACDIPIYGNMSDGTNGYVHDTAWVGHHSSLSSITISALPISDGEGGSYCVLLGVSFSVWGTSHNLVSDFTEPVFTIYGGNYLSLLSPVLGTHNSFGNNGQGPPFTVAGAQGYADNGGVYGATCTDPPTEYYDPVGVDPWLIETSCTPFNVKIEAYEGPPICESNPFVTAERCDGTGSPITVDLRDALPDSPSSPKLGGDLYRVVGDVSAGPADTDLWVSELCPGPPVEYRVYQRCNDPSDLILVDEAGKPTSAITALVGGDELLRYKPTPSTAFGEPTAVTWSLDDCPVVLGDQLWERCRINGSFYKPGDFYGVAGPPNRVRISNDITTSTVARMTITGAYYQTTPSRQCQDISTVYYHLITDDGGVYPYVGPGVPVSGSCGSTRDRYIRTFCRGNPNDPGDPQDPNDPRIIDQPQPPQPNPQQQQIEQFINPRCPSCGG
tara:strand:+ start:380343 stop:381980 length:1638 start_codon:yes stop_codon:yes gene_type:complete